MDKHVVLKFTGSLKTGCQVVLEIWSGQIRGAIPQENCRLEVTGTLPPNPQLAECLENHWKIYRSLGDPARGIRSRLTPAVIEYNGSFNCTEECRKSARDLEHLLRAWLDSREFRLIDRCLRDELRPRESIRVKICTEDSQLQKLPWHLWDWLESRQGEVEFSFLTHYPLAKFKPPQSHDKVRILAILGHSQGINVDTDREVLENLPDADVVFLVEPKRQDFSDWLWEKPWDILFFAGHSETEGDCGRIYLNPRDSLTLDELRYGLRQAAKKGLQLAIFNSCDGLGLAHKLGDLQLPQMVVMRELVSDQVAQSFLKYFLDAFAGGNSFSLSVRQARERLEGLEDECPCASWLPTIVAHPHAPELRWKTLLGVPVIPHSEEFIPKAQPQQNSWKKILASSLAMACMTIGVRSLGMLQTHELKAFDRLMQWQLEEPLDPRLTIITITEADIQAQDPEARQGSLSNETLDLLLQKLKAHKPRVIGLDIYRPFALGQQHQRLAQEFQNNDNLIAICEVGGGKDNPSIPPPPDVPLARVGFSDAPLDSDGIIRRQLFGMSSSKECATDLSFSFALAYRYLSAEGIEFKRTSPNSFQVGSVSFPRVKSNTGGYHQIDSGGYQVMLNYRTSGAPAQTVTLGDILNDRFEAQWIEDRIILIGTTARSIEDGVLTPYSAKFEPIQPVPGIFIQGQAVSQILSAVKDHRPILRSLPEWGEFLCIWLGAIAGEVIAIWVFTRWQRDFFLYLGTQIGELIVIVTIGYFALIQGVWIPIVPVGLASLLTGTRQMVIRSQFSRVSSTRETENQQLCS